MCRCAKSADFTGTPVFRAEYPADQRFGSFHEYFLSCRNGAVMCRSAKSADFTGTPVSSAEYSAYQRFGSFHEYIFLSKRGTDVSVCEVSRFYRYIV
mgnify:CR=1 FL=1